MDTDYFLKKRTKFIRFYYDAAAKPFTDVRVAIENNAAPYDDRSPYDSECEEPPFLKEWMDAHAATNVLGLSCVSLLSDSLKLYFRALETRVIFFGFKDRKSAFKAGFVRAYLAALKEILDTDWSDCSAKVDVIEQMVLARNRGQHGESVDDFGVTHDHSTMKKYPNPFFASEEELQSLPEWKDEGSTFLLPAIEVTRDKLFIALDEVEKLAEYIEGRLEKAHEWRMHAE